VLSAQIFFFRNHRTLKSGGAVLSAGDDDAVPDGHMDEDLMTGRPQETSGRDLAYQENAERREG
jgi:hypothetical protein